MGPEDEGAWEPCTVCKHGRWRHHHGVCTEYVGCACEGHFQSGPITLTREQMNILSGAAYFDDDIADPDPPWRAKVDEITRWHTVLVDRVEESTPYIMRWLGAPDRP
jgi:hypothetical protein